jgi:ribosome maturation factor RimP
MITKKQITKLVEEQLEGSDNYVVNVDVKPGNQIQIEIDNDNGLDVSDCVGVSRYLEDNLDRDVDDFGLSVSSPGVGAPFRNERQYHKYLNKKVEVVTIDGQVIQGVLLKKDEEIIDVETEKGKKGAIKKKEVVTISINNIKETKSVISFK